MLTIKIIRLDEKAYIQFKIECVKNNLTVGQGFTEAINAWANEVNK